MKICTYFIGTFKASRNDFIDHIHKIFRFANDMIDFDECGRFAHCMVFNRKLQGLYICWNLIQMIKQFFFMVTSWNLGQDQIKTMVEQ